MGSHWLDPIWRRLAARVQPYVLPRYSVDIRNSTLYATDDNPAVRVTAGATHVAISSCRVERVPSAD